MSAPQLPPPTPAFSFDSRFQLALVKLIVDEDAFVALAAKHMTPGYFENPAQRWVVDMALKHFERYGHAPGITAVYEYLRTLDPLVAVQYQPTVVSLEAHGRIDAQFVGDRVVDFVKRNHFVSAFSQIKQLYNSNNADAAYEVWARRAEEHQSLRLGEVDRSDFFADFEERQKHRMAVAANVHQTTFSTGIVDLDVVLNGGLSLGEMGLWIAPDKLGKSFLLTWLAFYAVRALHVPVLDFVLEGGRSLHEDRFDAAFSSTLTALVKRGELTQHQHRILVDEYRELRGLLIVRAFTKDDDAWQTTVADIYAEVKEQRRTGKKPKLIVVDYADLLRAPGADSENEHQTSCYKGLRKLCDRDEGYALWSASQLQRPNPRAAKDANYVHRGRAQQGGVADSINKIRIPDFYGSINATDDEKQNNRARLFAEEYRHGKAGKVIHVETDYDRGRFLRSVLSTSSPADEEETQGRFF